MRVPGLESDCTAPYGESLDGVSTGIPALKMQTEALLEGALHPLEISSTAAAEASSHSPRHLHPWTLPQQTPH